MCKVLRRQRKVILGVFRVPKRPPKVIFGGRGLYEAPPNGMLDVSKVPQFVFWDVEGEQKATKGHFWCA